MARALPSKGSAIYFGGNLFVESILSRFSITLVVYSLFGKPSINYVPYILTLITILESLTLDPSFHPPIIGKIWWYPRISYLIRLFASLQPCVFGLIRVHAFKLEAKHVAADSPLSCWYDLVDISNFATNILDVSSFIVLLQRTFVP